MSIRICDEIECAPLYGDVEDCEFYQKGFCTAPTPPCSGCHWHRPEDSVIKCLNLSMDNWKAVPEGRCVEFILSKDYRPTGAWAEVAEVISQISQTEPKIKENDCG